MASFSAAPRRMIAPLPKAFSTWLSAISSARSLSGLTLALPLVAASGGVAVFLTMVFLRLLCYYDLVDQNLVNLLVLAGNGQFLRDCPQHRNPSYRHFFTEYKTNR